jgi:hypothetical protein
MPYRRLDDLHHDSHGRRTRGTCLECWTSPTTIYAHGRCRACYDAMRSGCRKSLRARSAIPAWLPTDQPGLAGVLLRQRALSKERAA